MLKSTICLVSLPFFLGCGPNIPPRPGPAPHSDKIGEMCQHLKAMNCEEGQDVYNDNLPGPEDVPNQSCEDFHLELQKQGFDVNPKCVIQSPDCESIEDYRAKSSDDC